tara:strand:+ start:92 stop:376 length:285 start_codon:yes stop_codon:yes gene_type:complete
MGIPYFPTYAATSLFEYDDVEDKDQSVSIMRNQLATHKWMVPYSNTERRHGFYDWAKQSGFPFYSTHPGEEAHEEFAKQFTEFYQHKLLKDPPF